MRTRNSLSGARSSLFETLGNALALLVLIVACTSTGYSQTPDTAEGYVETGNKLFQMGSHDYAIAAYTKAIELKPDLADAYNNRAYVYTHQANLIQNTAGNDTTKEKKKLELARLAIADYDKAIALRPHYAVYYRNRASAYVQTDPLKAVTDLSTAIKIDPKDPATWNERCRLGTLIDSTIALDARSWNRESISACTEAIRLRPDLVDAYINRGRAKMEFQTTETLDGAIEDYSRAIELRPDLANLYSIRSDAYRARFKLDLALADATTAVTLRPEDAAGYYRRGLVYLFQSGLPPLGFVDKPNKSFDRRVAELAVEDFNKAIQLRPNYAQAYAYRSLVLCALGMNDQSLADNTKAIALGGNTYVRCR